MTNPTQPTPPTERPAEPTLSPRDQFEADKRSRIQQCSERIAAALTEFECDLAGIPQYTPDGRTVCAIQLVAK